MKSDYERIEVSLHPDVARLLETARGQIPRAVFVRSLVRDYLLDTLGEEALKTLPPEDNERPGRKTLRKPPRIHVEFLLHPEMAKLLDETQDLPRATFVRSLIKSYLRDHAEFIGYVPPEILKDEV